MHMPRACACRTSAHICRVRAVCNLRARQQPGHNARVKGAGMVITREKTGVPSLVFLICVFLTLMLTATVAAAGTTANMVEVWSVPISDYAYCVSVSDSGRVAAVVGINKVSHMCIYAARGELEKDWNPPRGSSFQFCLIRKEYVLATYGDVVSLFGAGGTEQLWVKSLRDLWSEAVTMSTDSKRIVIASYPPDDKSAVLMLDMEGNVLWNRQVESNVTDTAITPEGFVVAGGEKYGYLADKGGDAVYLFRRNGSLAWRKETQSPVIDVAISDDCGYIVVGLDNGGMIFLDGDGEVLWQKEDIGAWVDLSADGQLIVASSISGLVVLRADGNTVWENNTMGFLPGGQDSLNISQDGQSIVGLEAPMKYQDNDVFVFDRTGQSLYSKVNSTTVPRIAVSLDGRFVAVAFAKRLVLLRRDQ